jgi:hypothetical protein
MAIAHQPAMPDVPVTTRPQPRSAQVGSRHSVLVPVEEPRIGWVVVRLGTLMVTTAFTVGIVCALVLAIVTGTLTQVGT